MYIFTIHYTWIYFRFSPLTLVQTSRIFEKAVKAWPKYSNQCQHCLAGSPMHSPDLVLSPWLNHFLHCPWWSVRREKQPQHWVARFYRKVQHLSSLFVSQWGNGDWYMSIVWTNNFFFHHFLGPIAEFNDLLMITNFIDNSEKFTFCLVKRRFHSSSFLVANWQKNDKFWNFKIFQNQALNCFCFDFNLFIWFGSNGN